MTNDRSGTSPRPERRRALLSLGSNLGDSAGYLRAALAEIPDLVRCSDHYETDPVGGPDQDVFLNVVAELDTALSARQLLELCQRLEANAERVRKQRWGPRTLDVDVLWIDGETVDEPDLIIPHERMFERAFVMVPLGELAPDLVAGWVDPCTGEVRHRGPL